MGTEHDAHQRSSNLLWHMNESRSSQPWVYIIYIYIYIITRRHIRVERACLFSFPHDLISSLKLYV